MKSIFVRYTLALLVAIFSNWFLFVLTPLTLYGSYFLLKTIYEVTLMGNVIIIGGSSFNIISACTALVAFILLAVLVLTTRRMSLKERIKIFLIGSLIVYLANILRIFVLVVVYMQFGEYYFDAVHLVFWHIVSTLFVAITWIVLVEFYKIKSVPIYSDIKFILRYLGKQ